MKHYVYKISNIIEDKHYIGVRSSKNPIKDLGIKYFSSSRDKEFMLEQQEFPERFEYKILEVFSSRDLAVAKEIELHDLYDVVVNESFYNRSKQTSSGFCTYGTKLSEEHIIKISPLGRTHSEATRRKISKSNMGKNHTEESKRKMSKSHTGKILSDEHRKNISNVTSGEGNPMWDKRHSEETIRKMSKSHTGKIVSSETKRRMAESRLKHNQLTAHRYIIYDNNDTIIHDEVITNIKKFFAENNYSSTSFCNSYRTNETIKGGKFKGWRVVRLIS